MANRRNRRGVWFNRAMVLLAWIIILIAVIVGIRYYFFFGKYETTNNAQVEQYITPINSRLTGYIKDIRFKENQYVHKGDTLVILDNQEYENKVALATSDLEGTEANMRVNEKAIIVSNSTIRVQKAKIDAAKVEVWKAEQDYVRFKNLLGEDAATLQQFEQVKANYDVAKARLQALQNEEQVATTQMAQVKSQNAPIESTRNQKGALLKNADLFLSYTIVTAPYDGWVGKKNIQIGQLIREGQVLVNVVSQEKWITANFRETQIADLDLGTQVIIKADAYPKIEFEGVIESFSPASGTKFSLLPQDNSTGNFVKIEQRIPIRIVFKKGQNTDKLRAGMNVVVNAVRK